jgi:hypothetical protein
MVCSEYGSATMVTELSNQKQGMRLEGRKNVGASGAVWETWNGHQASVTAVDDGSIWESNCDDCGSRRRIG